MLLVSTAVSLVILAIPYGLVMFEQHGFKIETTPGTLLTVLKSIIYPDLGVDFNSK